MTWRCHPWTKHTSLLTLAQTLVMVDTEQTHLTFNTAGTHTDRHT